MKSNFTPLPEIQKMFTFSPIKTWRLFDKLRREGKLVNEQDWAQPDREILIDLPRFFTELETEGYKNILHDEFKGFQTKSYDNNLNSDEITDDEKIKETDDEVKSHENKLDEMISHDNDNNTSSEVLEVKEEIIEILKRDVERAEKEAGHLRQANEYLAQQNQRLTQLTYMLMAPKREGVEQEQESPEAEDVADEKPQEPDPAPVEHQP